MARRSGNSFSNFGKPRGQDDFSVKPIKSEFGGSVPDSLYTVNRESAWSRWRRGFELASSSTYDNDYSYEFKYEIPATTTSGNPNPVIYGAFVGFPTASRELGMHWAVWRYAGSVRTDKLTDPVSSNKLYVESVTEDSTSWYVKLAGTWSASNPLPAPFYIPVSGQPEGLKPALTEIFEDRIIVADGPIIDKNTINPSTQTRYGYVQAVVTAIDPFNGILTFKKAGSIYVTPDTVFTSPAPQAFTPGRFLITGSRYCCTCQDFTHRDYSFLFSNGKASKKRIPVSKISTVKPGRFELTKRDGILDNSAMTSADVDRSIEINAPGGFELDYTVASDNVTDKKATRDNPGVYREFGFIYTRATKDISFPGSAAEGIPSFNDYSSRRTQPDFSSIPQDELLVLSDNWTPLLDELRYCKHIYALKFKDNLFPPEPSDFPVDIESMVEWEQELVEKSKKEQERAKDAYNAKRALSLMDVPTYNCQSPVIYPMLQKLFNITTDRISIQNFTMYDKNGSPYQP